MNENIEYDGAPAFHKMGFVDDLEGLKIKEMKRKYIEKYVSDVKRERMGGSKNIHCPETEINPPTPF